MLLNTYYKIKKKVLNNSDLKWGGKLIFLDYFRFMEDSKYLIGVFLYE